MNRHGMTSDTFWLLIKLAFVLFAGGIIAWLILTAGSDVSFCDWWDQFFPNIPLIGDRLGLTCPFPE